MQIMETITNRHLGQKSEYETQYNSDLLVTEPRKPNREKLGILESALPFVGVDTWNGYEFSTLLTNGLPIAGIARVVFPANSKCIIESKSMKLYWNSYNMTRMGVDDGSACQKASIQAERDIRSLIGIPQHTTFYVDVYPSSGINGHGNSHSSEMIYTEMIRRQNYKTLETELSEAEHVPFDQYSDPNINILNTDISNNIQQHFWHSSLLKSNCEYTGQPDFADVYIYYKGVKYATPISILRYIVAYRDERNFHEKIAERIYKDLQDALNPDELMVECFYTRRGGWDLNIIRASSWDLIPQHLQKPSTWLKTLRQ